MKNDRTNGRTDKFYQACYTRADGGWKILNQSPDIPRTMLSFFQSNETGNTVSRSVPKDAKGNPLWMLEIAGDGDNIGMMRVQYGVLDELSRANRFSHGYLFSNAYELLKNPNALLCIADENFQINGGYPAIRAVWDNAQEKHGTAFSGYEALKLCIQKSSVIPTKLVMMDDMTVEGALRDCGMEQEQYRIFVQCMYYALSTRTKNTIYVQTDGTDAMARSLLFLLYSAVPYSLRPRITASTCAEIDNQDKTMVFCKQPPANRRYVNPHTGENTIMTPSLEKRWERNPFIVDFVENRDGGRFALMEAWLERMGNARLDSMDALMLAYNMSFESSVDVFDDAEIAEYLFDWLALPVENTKGLELFVTELLKKAVQRKILLNEETGRLLVSRAKTAIGTDLLAAYYDYIAFSVSTMSAEEGSDYLRGFEKTSEIFQSTRSRLREMPTGQRILDEYYRQETQELIQSPTCNRRALEAEYVECREFVRILPEIKRDLSEKNRGMARKGLQEGAPYQQIFAAYQATEAALEVSTGLKDLEDEYDRLFRERFDKLKWKEYIVFYRDRKQQYPQAYTCLVALHYLTKNDYKNAKKCWKRGGRIPELAKVFVRFALDYDASRRCRSLDFWELLADESNQSMIEMMARQEAVLLYDADLLDKSLQRGKGYWSSDEKVKNFCQDSLDYIRRHPQLKKLLKESCCVLDEVLDEIEEEEKRLRKEQQKEEKRKSREEKHRPKTEKQKTQQRAEHDPPEGAEGHSTKPTAYTAQAPQIIDTPVSRDQPEEDGMAQIEKEISDSVKQKTGSPQETAPDEEDEPEETSGAREKGKDVLQGLKGLKKGIFGMFRK